MNVIVIHSIQCRLNAWARWAVAWEPLEHKAPMIIYVCGVRYVFNV